MASPITREGYENLKAIRDRLIEEALPILTERLEQIRGEVSGEEDTDLFEVMSEKNRVDERIREIDNILANSVILDEDLDPDAASPGDRILVVDMDTNEEEEFNLLGSQEVSHGQEGVSIESPVGRALLGKKIGEMIDVEVPDGRVRYKIVKFLEAYNQASQAGLDEF